MALAGRRYIYNDQQAEKDAAEIFSIYSLIDRQRRIAIVKPAWPYVQIGGSPRRVGSPALGERHRQLGNRDWRRAVGSSEARSGSK